MPLITSGKLTVPQFAGILYAPASVAASAGLKLGIGVAPTSPADGDVWPTTAGIYARINGVSKQLDAPATTSAGDLTSGNLAYARLPTGNGSWDVGVGNVLTLTRAVTVSGILTASGEIRITADTVSAETTAGSYNNVNTGTNLLHTIGPAAGHVTYTGALPPAGSPSLRIYKNDGPGNWTLKHDNASSDAANRFYCPGNVDLVLSLGEAVWIVYYQGRHRIIGLTN